MQASTARTVYVTNAVKHFKFERRGKRRIHSKPDAGEIEACRWWIEMSAR
jgi:DNA polymerase